jgi:hypothetical protein
MAATARHSGAGPRRMSAVRRPLAVLVILGAVASVGVATAATANDPKKDIKPAVQAQARAINVKRGDLLGGPWKSSPTPPNKGNTPKCSFYDPDQSDLTENGDADSPTFTLSDGSNLSSTVGIFVSAAQGAIAYTRVVQPELPRCLAQLILKSGGTKFSLRSTGALAFPKYGDRSAAYRVSLLFTSGKTKLPVIADVVAVNRGKTDVAFFFTATGTPFSARFEQHVVGRVVGRIPS